MALSACCFWKLVSKPDRECTYCFVLREFQATAFHLLNVWALLTETVAGAHRLPPPCRSAQARLTTATANGLCFSFPGHLASTWWIVMGFPDSSQLPGELARLEPWGAWGHHLWVKWSSSAFGRSSTCRFTSPACSGVGVGGRLVLLLRPAQ